MSVREIVRLGHPALRTAAEPVDPEGLQEVGMQDLIDDMVETMLAARGVGLAAPQVGVSRQLFVYDHVRAEASDESPVSPEVLVNPSVEPVGSDMVEDWEGCLSIPGLRGLVPRHLRVRVRGLDRRGGERSLEVEGLAARIIQHEYDHLWGVVFLDRMGDLRSLSYDREWERFVLSTAQEEQGGPTFG